MIRPLTILIGLCKDGRVGTELKEVATRVTSLQSQIHN